MPFTVISKAKNWVSRVPWYLSRAMDRDSTEPPAPAKPCKKRQTISMLISRVRAHIAEAKINSSRDSASGFRRPMRSLSGPKNS